MIIDATDIIMGRLAAFAAKKALQGEKVDVINAEKAVISGQKLNTINKFIHARSRGTPFRGPFISCMPHLLLRRVIRGMLPRNQARGREALGRVKCHIGVPDEFKGKEAEVLKIAHISKLQTAKRMTLGAVSKQMGAKFE